MSFILKVIKNMRWFLVSTIAVFILALFLGHHSSGRLGSDISNFILNHTYFWLFFRATMFLLFFFIWPLLVDGWAKKYKWSIEYTVEVKKRRWRYVVWFFIIDLTFQLL